MAGNPNPSRISAALWYFAECCLALQPGTEFGGIYAPKWEYHDTRDHILANGRTGDYSVRYGPDKLGPGDKAAAFDWTFPDAQNGRYGTIITYGARVRAAHQARDPRAYGFREVLIQADSDGDAEGYDFYLSLTRTPDDSHLWHGHFSVLRQFVNDFNAMNGMLSILAGESLETWRAGRSRYGGSGESENDMDGDQNRRLFNLEEYGSSTEDMLDDRFYLEWGKNPGDTPKKVPNRFVQAIKAIKSDVAEIKASLASGAGVELPPDFTEQVLARIDATVEAAVARQLERLTLNAELENRS